MRMHRVTVVGGELSATDGEGGMLPTEFAQMWVADAIKHQSKPALYIEATDMLLVVWGDMALLLTEAAMNLVLERGVAIRMRVMR